MGQNYQTIFFSNSKKGANKTDPTIKEDFLTTTKYLLCHQNGQNNGQCSTIQEKSVKDCESEATVTIDNSKSKILFENATAVNEQVEDFKSFEVAVMENYQIISEIEVESHFNPVVKYCNIVKLTSFFHRT